MNFDLGWCDGGEKVLLKRFLESYEVEVDEVGGEGGEGKEKETQEDLAPERSQRPNGGEAFSSMDEDFDSVRHTIRVRKYAAIIEKVARREVKEIVVRIEEIDSWCQQERSKPDLSPEETAELIELAKKIEENTLRYVWLIEKALDEMVRSSERQLRLDRLKSKTFNTLISHTSHHPSGTATSFDTHAHSQSDSQPQSQIGMDSQPNTMKDIDSDLIDEDDDPNWKPGSAKAILHRY